MDSEIDTPVMDVVLWLGLVAPDVARPLLVGCLLDDGLGDDAVEILDIDVERQALTLAGGRRVLLRAARDGVVVDGRPGAPLAEAVAGSWTAIERGDRADVVELGRAGILASKLASRVDCLAALAFIRVMQKHDLPNEPQRRDFYLALRAGDDPALARVGARFFTELMHRFKMLSAVPEDLYWRLARCRRRAGDLNGAIAVSEALHSRTLKDPFARKLLATIRAGALLASYEVRPNDQLLVQAERALKVAWALGAGEEEARELYRKLWELRDNGRSR